MKKSLFTIAALAALTFTGQAQDRQNSQRVIPGDANNSVQPAPTAASHNDVAPSRDDATRMPADRSQRADDPTTSKPNETRSAVQIRPATQTRPAAETRPAPVKARPATTDTRKPKTENTEKR
jgi:hypothetical protein